MQLNLKKLQHHPFFLVFRIFSIVYVFDFAFMEMLDFMRIDLGENESVIEPLMMGICAAIPVYFFIVNPYIKGRNETEAMLKKAHDAKAKSDAKHLTELKQQRERIENDFLHTTFALRESEKRYELAAKGSNDGLWDWDALNQNLYLSSRFIQMLGYPANEAPKTIKALKKIIHPNDLPIFDDAFKQLTRLSPYIRCTYRIENYLGDYLWVLIRGYALFNEKNEVMRIAGSQTDMTEQKNAEEHLMHNPTSNSLTGS